MTPIPDSASAAGATNTPEPARSASQSGNDGSGDLRAERIRDTSVILAVAFHGASYRSDNPCENSTLVSFVDTDGERSLRPLTIGEIAAAVDAAGYRRVVEDDDTIELVARALFGDFDGVVDGMTWAEDSERSREGYRDRARAAVRALREET